MDTLPYLGIQKANIVFFRFLLILFTFLGEDFETDSTPCNAFPCHASHCPPGYQYSSGQICYYWESSELTNAAEAAVACSVKHSGRPAVFMNRSAAKQPQHSRRNLTTLGMDQMIFQAV